MTAQQYIKYLIDLLTIRKPRAYLKNYHGAFLSIVLILFVNGILLFFAE